MPSPQDPEKQEFFICPNCGAEVRVGAASCPDCGSDEKTGWSEEAEKWDLDIPAGYGGEDSFDYDAFVRREFGTKSILTGKALLKKALSGLLLFIIFFALIRYLIGL